MDVKYHVQRCNCIHIHNYNPNSIHPSIYPSIISIHPSIHQSMEGHREVMDSIVTALEFKIHLK